METQIPLLSEAILSYDILANESIEKRKAEYLVYQIIDDLVVFTVAR